MKKAVKIALFAFVLGIVAVAGWTASCLGTHHTLGTGGKTLEFRVSAFNLESYGLDRPDGFDVFSGSQVRKIAESGEAPEGFKWLPVSDFYLSTPWGGVEPRGFLHTTNGKKFLLVSDRPEMILGHSPNAPAWGVKSVEITATNYYGHVVKRVQINLDDIGADLLQQFTKRYIHHSVGVIVDGQIVANFTLMSPMQKGLLTISFPEGDELEAESLRDSLMK
jgi:hypothetical protein